MYKLAIVVALALFALVAAEPEAEAYGRYGNYRGISRGGYYRGGYSGYNRGYNKGYYGRYRREAEAEAEPEAEAEADPEAGFITGYAGLPTYGAYGSVYGGYPYGVAGYAANYPLYGGYAAPLYGGYSAGLRLWKREAEAEPEAYGRYYGGRRYGGNYYGGRSYYGGRNFYGRYGRY